MNSLLHSKFIYGLTLVVVVQATLFYTASHGENTPLPAPLTTFPAVLGHWHEVEEGVIDQDTRDILRADDLMSRVYAGIGARPELFIAYFKTQRQGQSPHSPKNCLPGSGWQKVPRRPGASMSRWLPVPSTSTNTWFRKAKRRASCITGINRRDALSPMSLPPSFIWSPTRSATTGATRRLSEWWFPLTRTVSKEAEKTGYDFIQTAYPVVKAFLPQ